MSEMNNEIMNNEETKNFFEAAWEGICNAPTESKILCGIGALAVSAGIGIGSFFWGKSVGAAEFDPTKKQDNNQANNNQQANQNNQQAQGQPQQDQANNQQQNTQQQAQGQQAQQ